MGCVENLSNGYVDREKGVSVYTGNDYYRPAPVKEKKPKVRITGAAARNESVVSVAVKGTGKGAVAGATLPLWLFTACGLAAESFLDKPRSDKDAGTDTDTGTDNDASVPNVCDHAPGSFGLGSPANGAADVGLTPSLSWNASTDPDTGDSVTYRVQVSANEEFTSTVVNQAGLADPQFNVPAGALTGGTTYYWRVIASDTCSPPNTTQSIVRNFSTAAEEDACDNFPGAFNVTYPNDGAVNVPVQPNIEWTDSTDPDTGDAVTYDLLLCTDAACTSVVLEKTGLATSNYQVLPAEELDFDTTYHMYISAVDTCPQETPSTPEHVVFTTASEETCNNSPSAFNLESPATAATGVALVGVPFNWSDSTDPDLGDTLSYNLRVCNVPLASCTTPVIEKTGLASSQYTTVAGEELAADTPYYWGVTVEDACSQTTISTPAERTFTTLHISDVCDSDPGAFGLVYPADTAANISLTPTLTWDASTDPDLGDSVTYRVQVSTNSGFTAIVADQAGLTDTQYTIPASTFVNGETYYWRTIASDTCATPNTATSATRSFTTVVSATACDNDPSAPVLATPANGAVSVSLTPSFDWSNSTDPDAGDSIVYNLQVATDAGFSSIVLSKASLVSSNYTVLPGEALDGDTHYYWRAIAIDTCSQQTLSTSDFDFTTLHVADPCDNAPGAFNVSSPTAGAINVPLTPNVQWGASANLDSAAGDTIEYCVEIDNNPGFGSPELNQCGITLTNFTVPVGTLLNDTNYNVRVKAVDDCPLTTYTPAINFTTVSGTCTPGTYTDTNFTVGTHTDTVANSGTLSMAEDYTAWTTKYEAIDVPENDGWTENAPSGWTTKSVSGGVLHLSSLGINANAYYERAQTFNNSTGLAVEAKMQLVSTEGTYGCSLGVENGTKLLTFRFFSDHIEEADSGLSASFDTTTSSNVFRVLQKNNDFYLYANGSLLIDGTGQSLSGTSANLIRFHDYTGTNDSEALWDYIYSYNGGDVLPKKSSGNYLSERINTGTTSNDIGSGATINWNGTGTGTTMDVYASAGTTLPGTPCATGLSTSGATIPGTCSGQYVWIRTNLNNADATLQDFTLNYCTE